MSDVLDRVRAQMEHFKATVWLDAQLTARTDSDWSEKLVIGIGRVQLQLSVRLRNGGVFPVMRVCSSSHITDPTAVAQIGGMLIQFSNLMTQIQALAPEVPSVSKEQPEAVG